MVGSSVLFAGSLSRKCRNMEMKRYCDKHSLGPAMFRELLTTGATKFVEEEEEGILLA